MSYAKCRTNSYIKMMDLSERLIGMRAMMCFITVLSKMQKKSVRYDEVFERTIDSYSNNNVFRQYLMYSAEQKCAV